MKSNIRSVIRQLEQYKKQVEKNTEKLVKELVDEGEKQASTRLSFAEYTGDRKAEIETVKGYKYGEVSLVGEGAGFIEFGAGSTFVGGDMSHPLAGSIPDTTRGSYGEHHGYLPRWTFAKRGDVGTAPQTYEVIGSRGEPTGKVMTRGNRANRVIYDTGKELERRAIDKAKAVFGSD